MKKFVCILQVFAGFYLLGAFVAGVSELKVVPVTSITTFVHNWCENANFVSL